MTARRRLTIDEHSTLRAVELTPADADALRAGGARLVLRQRANGRYDIQTKQMVGTVRTAGLDLVIRPKVELDGFLDLLSHTPGLAHLAGQLHMKRWDDFLPALTRLYAEALTKALRRGLLRGYHHRHDALAYCRGKIDGLHLATRRFGVVPPIDCDFEEFSPDIEVNQRLKAAADFLMRSGFADGRVRSQLRSALDQFANVSDRRFRPSPRPLPRDRRRGFYSTAVDLANLVLSSASLDLRQGTVASVGFLVNMDDLYEAWVTSVLRDALGPPRARWRRHPPKLHLDHDRLVKLEPDAVWSPHGAPRIPIDAKYKRGSRIPNPDVYQMAAYCAGLQVSQGVVFCVSVAPYLLRLRNGVLVHVRRLSVGGSPEARNSAVKREVAFLRTLTAASRATAAQP